MNFAKLHEELLSLEKAFPLIVFMIYSEHLDVAEYQTQIADYVEALKEASSLMRAGAMRRHIGELLARARCLEWALGLVLARPRDDRTWERRGRFAIGPSSSDSSRATSPREDGAQ